MKHKIKAVFFDLDGTLVNSIYDIAGAMNYALEQLGFPTFTVEQYDHMVGNGMVKLCQRALPAGQEDKLDALLAGYKARYLSHCCDETRVYDGVPEMLAALRQAGLKLALISNKPQEQTDRVAGHYLPGMVDLAYGQREPFPVKPDPACFRFVAETLGVKPEEVLYCGDSAVDIQFARNAGAESLGCIWGFRGRKELEDAGAQHLAESPRELGEIALTLC